jgi:hypothetical protein
LIGSTIGSGGQQTLKALSFARKMPHGGRIIARRLKDDNTNEGHVTTVARCPKGENPDCSFLRQGDGP